MNGIKDGGIGGVLGYGPGDIIRADQEPMMLISVDAFNKLTIAVAEMARTLAGQTKPHFYDQPVPEGWEWAIYKGKPIQQPVQEKLRSVTVRVARVDGGNENTEDSYRFTSSVHWLAPSMRVQITEVPE